MNVSARIAEGPARTSALPRSFRSARLRRMRPRGTPSSISAAAWFSGFGGGIAGECSGGRHLAGDAPRRHAQVLRRPGRAGAQRARRGRRLGRLVRLRRPPPHDDEDSRLRAGRLLDLEPAPRAGAVRGSRRPAGRVRPAVADRFPGPAERSRLRRGPLPQALRAAARSRARKNLQYSLIFFRIGFWC